MKRCTCEKPIADIFSEYWDGTCRRCGADCGNRVLAGEHCQHCAGENGEHGIGCPDDPMPNAIADQQGHD